MESAIAERLLAFNHRFYTDFGKAFSATRRRIQPGVLHMVKRLIGNESILDLGCGNGELARLLARCNHRAAYTGLDFSLPLLGDAVDLPGQFTFVEADLTASWDEPIRRLATSPFNLVTAFAVLHHIPSSTLRLELLKKVHTLLEPGGRFIHSNWQFLNSPRLAARIQPWERAGLSITDVDPGDYLLDWRHGGEGLRYVHHFNEDELAGLAVESGFNLLETYHADGENGRLGLYQVWEKA